ncbi:MAG: glycosyltransferase family 2 protein [Anaerolineales bacterium]|nr:glycosyltransferase family 2 protein [Anaerolineales bacterium]
MTNNKAEQPCCSIVIRAYNEERHLGKLLIGIKKQSVQNCEVILVDSGSTDSTVEIASGFDTRIVSIDPEEFTFGRSLNWGIKATAGEFIIIISAHCYPVFPDWLEQLLKPFEDPQVAVCYGKQRGADSNYYSEHQFFRNYFPDISQPNQGQPFTHNANAAIRKSLWKQHPYDEQLTGLEDLAWSSWAKEQGYSIAYVADAEIIHIHEETINQVHNRYRREAIAMKQILPASQFSIRNMISMIIRKVVKDVSQARSDRVLLKEILNILQFRVFQYLGTWQGYRYSGKIDHQLHKRFYYPPQMLSEKIPESRLVEPINYHAELDEER